METLVIVALWGAWIYLTRGIVPRSPLQLTNPGKITGTVTLPQRVELALYSDKAYRDLNYRLGISRLEQQLEELAIQRASEPVLPPPVPAAAPVIASTTVANFRPGEPTSLEEYAKGGQGHFVEFLRAEIRTMRGGRLTRPQLFLGPPGLGKTLLARVVAADINRQRERLGQPPGEFILALGSDLRERNALDTLIRRANAREGNVLFVDEIHTLMSSENIDKWLLLLDEHRWQFQGDADPTALADFTILGATTDYGAILPAIRRRFAERQLQPMSAADIQQVVHARFPIAPDAARLLCSRTHYVGAPWEAIALATEADVLRRDRAREAIDVEDVEDVFRIMDLDRHGLRPHDRSVIHALLTQRREQRGRTKNDPPTIVYAASEDATVAMARVDREAYRSDIRPRLMGRGFLTTTSKGQTLTEAAVAAYRR